MTPDDLMDFLDEIFPQTAGDFEILEVAPMTATLRYPIEERHLRPGGTVSGPTIFAAADLAFYAAVLGTIGREPLAVTSNLNLNFLRKPEPKDLFSEARILRLGRTLAVGDVIITAEGDDRPVAHAQATYARPRRG